MEISDVRKRLQRVIEEARRTAAGRRARIDAASAAYEAFLPRVAAPLFRQLANALTAEGHPFTLSTPAGSLRLVSERWPQDFIEIELDASGERPVVIGRVGRGRGSRVMRTERPIREDAKVEELTEDDVLEFVLKEIAPLVER